MVGKALFNRISNMFWGLNPSQMSVGIAKQLPHVLWAAALKTQHRSHQNVAGSSVVRLLIRTQRCNSRRNLSPQPHPELFVPRPLEFRNFIGLIQPLIQMLPWIV